MFDPFINIVLFTVVFFTLVLVYIVFIHIDCYSQLSLFIHDGSGSYSQWSLFIVV